MAIPGMGMMAGMAAGQALVQALLGQPDAVGSMFGTMSKGGRRGAGMMEMMGRQGSARTAQTVARQQGRARQETPAQRPAFELVSKLPGRRRYRAAAMSGELADLLSEQLSKLDFLHDVQVNAATGSLLFIFEPNEVSENHMDKLAIFLYEHIFCPVVLGNRETGLPLEAHAGMLTKSIRGTVRDFSEWIKSSTGGWLDVSSAASLFFMFKGLQKMLATQQMPSGSQMFWWAVSLMRGWRTV